jgi:hypothetical protein
MGMACSTHRKKEIYPKYCLENLKGRNQDARVILK